MRSSLSFPRLSFALLALAVVAVLAFANSPAKAASCPAPTFAGGSFSSVTVTKATCGDAAKVLPAFTACRTKTGPSGRCVSKVNGYACIEIRTNGPTSFSSNGKCTRVKTKKVKKKKKKTKYVISFSYTQNL